MPTLFVNRCLLPVLLLWSLGLKAQNTTVRYTEVSFSFTPDQYTAAELASDPVKGEPIEILSPKGLATDQTTGVHRYVGDVKLRHKGTLLFCDQAIHYVADNRIDAIGHVLIVQGDTITVKADTLVYDGNSRRASLHGRVTFQDRRIILTSSQLDYNLASALAHYWNKGRLVDSRNVLTSQEGYYDTRSRTIEVQQAVRLASTDNLLTSYLLIYSVVSRMATLVQPARITGKDGVVVAQRGQYDTQTGQIQEDAVTVRPRYVGADVPQGYVVSDLTIAKESIQLLAKADKVAVVNPKNQPVASKETIGTTKEPSKTTAKSDVTRVAAAPVAVKPMPEKPVKPLTDKAVASVAAKPAALVAIKPQAEVPRPVLTGAVPDKPAADGKAVPVAAKPVAVPVPKEKPVADAPALTAQPLATPPKPNSPLATPVPVKPTEPARETVLAAAPLKKPKPVAVGTITAPVKPVEQKAAVPAPAAVVSVQKPAEPITAPVAVTEKMPVTVTPSVAVSPSARPVTVTSRGPGIPARPTVSTVAQAVADVDESDLERTLNRKKRSH